MVSGRSSNRQSGYQQPVEQQIKRAPPRLISNDGLAFENIAPTEVIEYEGGHLHYSTNSFNVTMEEEHKKIRNQTKNLWQSADVSITR